MKSFFKSLKKKSSNRDSAVPATHSSPFASKVGLDMPEHSDASSPSSSSSSVSTIQVPVVRLQMARSSSQDTFNSSVDDVLAHSKAPSRASPAPIPDQRFLSPRHPYSDIQRVAMPPSPPPRSPLNGGHGPPRNRKHGPPNVLEAQMTSINATKASPTRGGYYSPPRGQFTESLPQQKTRTIRFEASPSPIPHEAQLPRSRGRIPSDEHHLGARLQQLHKNTNSSSHTPEHANPGSPNARTLHPSRSSPHLPSSGRQNALESEDLSSLFPSPPPLIIRKRVPQPLVLQPRRPSAGSITPSSPDPSSSTESTPVSTPTSPGKQFSPPTQSPLSSKTYARHAKGIPPLLYDPPTSPLPSPPVNPQPKTPIPRFQGRVHLRGAQSTINLRSNENRGSPTHRMTSSDPVSEFLQQLGLEGHHSCSPLPQFESDQDIETAPHFSRTPRNAPVRWGYAL